MQPRAVRASRWSTRCEQRDATTRPACVLAKFDGASRPGASICFTLTGDAVDNVPGVPQVAPEDRWPSGSRSTGNARQPDRATRSEIGGVVGGLTCATLLAWLPAGRKPSSPCATDCERVPVQVADSADRRAVDAEVAAAPRALYEFRVRRLKRRGAATPSRVSGARRRRRRRRHRASAYTDAASLRRAARVRRWMTGMRRHQAPPPAEIVCEDPCSTTLASRALVRGRRRRPRSPRPTTETIGASTPMQAPSSASFPGGDRAEAPPVLDPQLHRRADADGLRPVSTARLRRGLRRSVEEEAHRTCPRRKHARQRGLALRGVAYDIALNHVPSRNKPHDYMGCFAWRHLSVKTITTTT